MLRSMLVLVAVLGALAPTLRGSASPHPAHVTIAQAEFNAKTNSLEVALRINPFDLEKALGARAKKRVNLDTTKDVDKLIVAYLNDAFVLETPGKKPAKLSWVGKEVFVHTAWLYFEFPLPNGPVGAHLTNGVLFDVQDDQVNTVNFRHGSFLKSLRHTIREPRHELPRAPE